MRFSIHYTVGEEEDTIVVEGRTVEECREAADKAVTARGGTNAWSQLLDGNSLTHEPDL